MKSILKLAILLLLAAAVGHAGPIPVVTVEPGTSATYPAGTNWSGFVSQSDNPLAPFSGQSVTFKGYVVGGNVLTFLYKLSYSQAVDISSIVIEGAAFNGGYLALLDSSMNLLDQISLSGNNNFWTFTLPTPGVSGQIFYLEENIEGSTTWRYRSSIVVNAENQSSVPEPASLLLLSTGLGVISLTVWRRRK
jgi:hypothetical protein